MKKNDKKVIIISTIALGLLFVFLIFVVLKYNPNAVSYCIKESRESLSYGGYAESFSCGGGSVGQFQYENETYHGILMFLTIGSMVIAVICELVALLSVIERKAFDFVISIFVIISAILSIISVNFLIKDKTYGNDPHLKENQVITS